MQKYLLWISGLMMIVLLNTAAISSAEPRTRYHSGSGAYRERSAPGSMRQFYNKQGSSAGRSVRQGNTVKKYNKRENMVDKSGQHGTTTKVYGRSRQNGWKIN